MSTKNRDPVSIFNEACQISTLVYIINRYAFDPKVHVIVLFDEIWLANGKKT